MQMKEIVGGDALRQPTPNSRDNGGDEEEEEVNLHMLRFYAFPTVEERLLQEGLLYLDLCLL